MQVYRIISDDDSVMRRYYTGATESSKVARELSKDGSEVSVYEYTTPTVAVDKGTFIMALNEEPWCEPKRVAHFVGGRTVKD